MANAFIAPGKSLAVVVASGALVLSVALGARQTFGLFIGPIAADHLVTIGFLSFAIALQNLIWGLAQPFAGALTDRFGPAPVVAGGAIAYGAGLFAVVHRPDALAVVLGFGVLAGVGQSAMTFAVVIASVSRAADAARRATAVAFVAAGGSLGQVALVPVAQIAISHAGFRAGLTILAVVIVAAAPMGLLLRRGGHVATVGSAPVATGSAIRTALRDPNFLFLSAGFFACGFQLAFMGLHLPTYLGMCHVGANVGAAALATIGFFNIIGSFGFGRLADRVQPQLLLTILYAVRATATAAFLIVPISAVTTLAFAVVMGLTWLGTVPLTNAVIARLHGLPNLGALFGVCFVGHQLGSFVGAWAGGLALQYTGSYTIVWITIVAAGYAAAVLNVPIRFRTPLVPAT